MFCVLGELEWFAKSTLILNANRVEDDVVLWFSGHNFDCTHAVIFSNLFHYLTSNLKEDPFQYTIGMKQPMTIFVCYFLCF